jgi:sigma-54 dependent transcriptional regulator, flagellar regulatory protein
MKIQHRGTFRTQPVALQREDGYRVIGDSPAAQALRQMVVLAAKSDGPVLITGPFGSEHSCLARAIHAASNRSSGPFVRINCGTSVRGSNMAEHRLETSHNGTLFLENANEMSVDVQLLVWQLVSGQPSQHIPSQQPPPLNIRVIAASNQCLTTKVNEGLFRSDLMQRLGRMTLPVAPLRGRRVDVEAMIDDYLLNYDPTQRFTIDWGARQELRAHHWPGNERELRSLVARACLFHPGQNIGSHRMRSLLAMGHNARSVAAKEVSQDTPSPIGPNFNLKSYLNSEEERYIHSALEQANGVIQHAAYMTGMKRTTFLEKMRKHGIERRRFRSRD